MKASELRELPHEELREKLAESKQELFDLRFQLATNQLDNSARLSQVRRQIARIATAMREQEIEAYYEMEDGNDG